MVDGEQALLSVIGEEVDFILETVSGKSKEEFMESKLLQHGLCMAMLAIGECISHLSSDFKHRHNEILWVQIVEVRSATAHGDRTIDMGLVWKAATEGAPQLHEFLSKLA